MEIDVIRIFAKVVQSGNYTRAASILQLPKSSVSRAVSRLEQESGTKLLLRTTRSVTLTAAGRAFYDSCIGPLQQLEDARKSISGNDSFISGLLRITAPEDLGASIITPTLADLCKKHADLKFDVHYTNQIIDLVKEGFDLAVRIGELKDSQLKATKLGELKLILVASKNYLADKKIKSVEDLAHCNLMSISSKYSRATWKLKSEKNKKTLNFEAKVICNQMSSLLKLAEEGAGIALVPDYLCAEKLKDKSLTHVLSDYYEEGYPVWMLSPYSVQSNAKIKVLTAELKRNMSLYMHGKQDGLRSKNSKS